MAIPTVGVKGAWSAQNANLVPYAGPEIWGTGINAVHSEYGEGSPLRMTGRNPDEPGERQAPYMANPEFVELHAPWGYTSEDSAATPYIQDGWPELGQDTAVVRAVNTTHRPPWNATGSAKNLIRSIYNGARKANYKTADSLPSETVTEGWRNKARGNPADALPSDPSQYEMQTSMTQRYKVRGNESAVSRATDEARSSIGSRVAGQKLKIYSGEERHYDMFPQQQTEILRPFWYRNAGTGREYNMLPNEMFVATPLQRVPPPDPSLGVTETDASLDYGYTAEDDNFYAIY